MNWSCLAEHRPLCGPARLWGWAQAHVTKPHRRQQETSKSTCGPWQLLVEQETLHIRHQHIKIQRRQCQSDNCARCCTTCENSCSVQHWQPAQTLGERQSLLQLHMVTKTGLQEPLAVQYRYGACSARRCACMHCETVYRLRPPQDKTAHIGCSQSHVHAQLQDSLSNQGGGPVFTCHISTRLVNPCAQPTTRFCCNPSPVARHTWQRQIHPANTFNPLSQCTHSL